MADTIRKDTQTFHRRFSCDCLHPIHVLDIVIEKGETWRDICFGEKYAAKAPIFERIRDAIQLILGRELWVHDFRLREQDLSEMIEILSSLLLQGTTASNIPWEFHSYEGKIAR